MADVRGAIGVAAVLGGGGFVASRFAPIENDYKNGWPSGGQIETSDLKLAAGLGAVGLAFGSPMGLVGAAIADAPKSALGGAMVMGAIGTAALGAGIALGLGARD